MTRTRWAASVVAAAMMAGCCAWSAPRHSGPTTDHFDGGRFKNPWPGTDVSKGPMDLIRWQANRDKTEWPSTPTLPPGPPPPKRVGRGALRVTFVGHSTLLVQVDGLNVLTDPVWSDSIGPAGLPGLSRKRPPGVRFEDLPPIDVVLVSHNHYDHMDVPTLERLSSERSPRVFTGLGNAEYLASRGIERVTEGDWWDSFRVADELRIHIVPARHRSNRGTCDIDGTLWTGFVIESGGGNVYFAGDTGWAPHFAEIGRRFAPIRLAMLPIGSYRPRWFMQPMHIDPAEAVRAHLVLGAHTSIAMHFATFQQADDGETEPVEALEAALERLEPARRRFIALQPGEAHELR